MLATLIRILASVILIMFMCPAAQLLGSVTVCDHLRSSCPTGILLTVLGMNKDVLTRYPGVPVGLLRFQGRCCKPLLCSSGVASVRDRRCFGYAYAWAQDC